MERIIPTMQLARIFTKWPTTIPRQAQALVSLRLMTMPLHQQPLAMQSQWTRAISATAKVAEAVEAEGGVAGAVVIRNWVGVRGIPKKKDKRRVAEREAGRNGRT